MINKLFSFKKRVLIVTIILLITLNSSGCSFLGTKTEKAEKDKDPDKVVLTLDWTPNTNHTGLYTALEKGYYAEENIEIEIIQPAGGTAEQLVASNQAQFGITFQENVTFARAKKMPIVSIAAIIQKNTSGFASIESKNIKSPKDFTGKKYGGWGSEVEDITIKALMDTYGGDYSKVEILTTGPADFLAVSKKNADFSWIYYGWDGIAAELKGVKLNYIEIAGLDEVFNYYTPVIISNEDLVAKDQELVERFMRATSQGYNFVINNPEEGAEILLKYAPELDKQLVYASQKWLSPRYAGEEENWGIQKSEVWERYMNWLYEKDLLEEKIDIEKAYTNEFIGK